MILPAHDVRFSPGDGPLLPVTAVPAGSWVRVAAVGDGGGAREHLADLGVLAGAPLRVIRAHGSGPVLLEVMGSRLAVGRGVARHLVVRTLDGVPGPATEPAS